jgi:hypothetical protein
VDVDVDMDVDVDVDVGMGMGATVNVDSRFIFSSPLTDMISPTCVTCGG